jgi:hypothetical protein
MLYLFSWCKTLTSRVRSSVSLLHSPPFLSLFSRVPPHCSSPRTTPPPLRRKRHRFTDHATTPVLCWPCLPCTVVPPMHRGVRVVPIWLGGALAPRLNRWSFKRWRASSNRQCKARAVHGAELGAMSCPIQDIMTNNRGHNLSSWATSSSPYDWHLSSTASCPSDPPALDQIDHKDGGKWVGAWSSSALPVVEMEIRGGGGARWMEFSTEL